MDSTLLYMSKLSNFLFFIIKRHISIRVKLESRMKSQAKLFSFFFFIYYYSLLLLFLLSSFIQHNSLFPEWAFILTEYDRGGGLKHIPGIRSILIGKRVDRKDFMMNIFAANKIILEWLNSS